MSDAVLVRSPALVRRAVAAPAASRSAADKTIQAVVWSPAREEFALIQGFQPATASLWTVDKGGCRARRRECWWEWHRCLKYLLGFLSAVYIANGILITCTV